MLHSVKDFSSKRSILRLFGEGGLHHCTSLAIHDVEVTRAVVITQISELIEAATVICHILGGSVLNAEPVAII